MPQVTRTPEMVIAIIGGGFTGAATAWHLARLIPQADAQLVIFEPRAKLGAGLAYDTADPVHRINVPARKMSLDPAAPNGFADWLAENGSLQADSGAQAANGEVFPTRKAFGDYVNSAIAPYVASGRVEHRRKGVQSVRRAGDRWLITTKDGERLEADRVIIATSHPAPAAPAALAAILEGNPRFVADATLPGALDAIRHNDSVLLVGNGLTSADVVASLTSRGHAGKITSISRRGLRSRGHAARDQEAYGDFTTRPIRSARLLSRRIRETIREATAFGLSWHAVLDAVRGQAFQIWQNLPVAERIRLVRHLRPFWDVHRFRIAPQVEQAVDDAITSGQLTVLAASVAAVSYHEGRIRAALRLARGRGTVIRDFDAVIVTTGPAHGGIFDSQAFLAELRAAGVIRPDAARLGIDCDLTSRAVDKAGSPVDGLYIAGPLARGTFGELMGLPQVSDHAAAVAQQIVASLGGAQQREGVTSDAA